VHAAAVLGVEVSGDKALTVKVQKTTGWPSISWGSVDADTYLGLSRKARDKAFIDGERGALG
jgi:hypothetical protein